MYTRASELLDSSVVVSLSIRGWSGTSRHNKKGSRGTGSKVVRRVPNALLRDTVRIMAAARAFAASVGEPFSLGRGAYLVRKDKLETLLAKLSLYRSEFYASVDRLMTAYVNYFSMKKGPLPVTPTTLRRSFSFRYCAYTLTDASPFGSAVAHGTTSLGALANEWVDAVLCRKTLDGYALVRGALKAATSGQRIRLRVLTSVDSWAADVVEKGHIIKCPHLLDAASAWLGTDGSRLRRGCTDKKLDARGMLQEPNTLAALDNLRSAIEEGTLEGALAHSCDESFHGGELGDND